MKLYRFGYMSIWQALASKPEHAISASAASEDRDALKIAARHDGEVYVSDEAGTLAIVYLYMDGAESVRYPWPLGFA
jgi:hypothetical protein